MHVVRLAARVACASRPFGPVIVIGVVAGYRAGMKSGRVLLLSLSLPFWFACQATPPAAVPAANAPAPKDAAGDDKKDDAKAKAEAKKQKQKELRQKQRELEAAQVEQRVADLDRAVRQVGVQRALDKTADELAHARAELEGFLKDVKPRELEAKRIGLDASVYRAEHSKDELGELTAMYEADEFARKTKELVLKRGRRDLEMAERQLAVAQKESKHFETVELADRERELRSKLADAEVERKKAETDAEKAKLEAGLADKKAKERLADLAEDIAELQEAIAKEKS